RARPRLTQSFRDIPRSIGLALPIMTPGPPLHPGGPQVVSRQHDRPHPCQRGFIPMNRNLRIPAAVCLLLFLVQPALAAHSVARRWNEVMLSAIRTDLARPT